MDVDEVGFWTQLVPILRSICDATFVAIDLEMSGIPMRGYGSIYRSRLAGRPSLQDLYEETREASMKYQALQIGITCIEEDRERDIYVARPYNFNVSPLLIHGDKLDIKRDITFQSGAIQFLMKNSFDIGAVFTKGIPYLSREEESIARARFSKKQAADIPDIVISLEDTEAVTFYANARKTISDFTNQKKQELDFVNIGHPDGLNGLQRRLVHQLVRNEFPSYRTFARGGGEFMQVEKLDPEREAMITRQRLVTLESSLARQTGLRFLFEALVGGDLNSMDLKWFRVDENNKPAFTDMEALKETVDSLRKALKKKSHVIVGHNMFIDLVFLYRTFVGTLPDQVTEFKTHIHEFFPRVFDTKYLATEAGSSMRNKSSLKDLCDELKNRHNPFIALAERHSSYGLRNKEHEAGYDSWMTAQVFIKLSAKLAAEQGVFGGLGGAVGSGHGTSYNEADPEDTTLKGSKESHLSGNARRASSNENKLQDPTPEKSTRPSHRSSGSSTMEGPKSKRKFGTSFADTNIFDSLDVEGQNDGDSTRSSSPDHESGGVPLEGNSRAHERTLMDSDMDDKFRAAFDEHGLLEAQTAELTPVFEESHRETPSGGLSRYFDDVEQGGQTPDPSGDEARESPWIPSIDSSFWDIYANKLRVYATESEVCYLGA